MKVDSAAASVPASHPQVKAQKPRTTEAGKAGSAAAPKASPAGTTVTISSAAQAAMAEARETPAQTAKEAQHNDMQARRLVAREAADRAATK